MRDLELIHLLREQGWEIIRVQFNYCVLKKEGMYQTLPFLNEEVPADVAEKVMGKGQ